MTPRARTSFVLSAAMAIVLVSCSPPGSEPATGPSSPTETVGDVAATGPGSVEEQTDEFEARLEVSDQTTDGTSVTVDRANLVTGRGWAVVYADADGAPGAPLGWAQIVADQGPEPLTVDLEEPLDAGETTLWVIVHIDAEPVGDFDVGTDEFATANGDTVRASFTAVVEDA